MQHFFPCLCRFSRRYNHSGIRYGNPYACNNLFKNLIRNAVVKHVGINIIRTAHPRHADSMRADSFICLQVLCVHYNSGKIIPIIVQAEQHAKPHIIYAAVHCTVHCFGMVGIITFRAGRVQLFILFFMISLLKQNISTYACLFQLSIVIDRSGSNIYIHPADCTVFMLDAVYRMDTFQYIFQRIVDRIFSGF